MDVERSVTILAAQVASEVTNLPTRAASEQPQKPVTTSDAVTPGVAPPTVAAIPQSSTGTSAPTQPSTDTVVPISDSTIRFGAPTQNALHPKSLVRQVLDALDESRVESHKVHKYLPDFFQKLREDLRDELRGHREQTLQSPAAGPSESSTNTASSALFAYQALSLTSISLSIRT